jgi:exoribonuclease II
MDSKRITNLQDEALIYHSLRDTRLKVWRFQEPQEELVNQLCEKARKNLVSERVINQRLIERTESDEN